MRNTADPYDMTTELSPIFIDMIAPKWPRAIHKLARVFSRDHRNTHGY